MPTSTESQKKQESSRKPSTSASLTMQILSVVDHNKLENVLRDGNTKPPDLAPEKSVCGSRCNRYNQTWINGLLANLERRTSRLYIVTLLI